VVYLNDALLAISNLEAAIIKRHAVVVGRYQAIRLAQYAEKRGRFSN